ncbi:MAG TPA: SPOR domain-containing protein [Gammaproteobacteria bacterium]|nr:SPOR domain-containing protein [Gammaproteobacteria bacterium]
MARRNRNSHRNQSAPGWVWMLFGLGLGLVVAIGVYLRAPSAARPEAPAETLATAERPASRPASRTTSAQPERGAEAENRFEFYEILPQYEVVVGDDAPATGTASATANTRRRPAATPGSYLLQVGSYGAAADADRIQASLALLGFESHVQRATLDGNVFNRVRIGPIVDLDAAKRTQRQLRAAGYDPLLMQVPK